MRESRGGGDVRCPTRMPRDPAVPGRDAGVTGRDAERAVGAPNLEPAVGGRDRANGGAGESTGPLVMWPGMWALSRGCDSDRRSNGLITAATRSISVGRSAGTRSVGAGVCVAGVCAVGRERALAARGPMPAAAVDGRRTSARTGRALAPDAGREPVPGGARCSV
jgi:hypothetical protein